MTAKIHAHPAPARAPRAPAWAASAVTALFGSSPAAAAAPRATLSGGSDDALRTQVRARLAASRGWHADFSNVVVDAGVVLLQGLIRDPGDRRAALAAVSGVAGVRELRDMRVLAREG